MKNRMAYDAVMNELRNRIAQHSKSRLGREPIELAPETEEMPMELEGPATLGSLSRNPNAGMSDITCPKCGTRISTSQCPNCHGQ